MKADRRPSIPWKICGARVAGLFLPLQFLSPLVLPGGRVQADPPGFQPNIRVEYALEDTHVAPALAWGMGSTLYAAFTESPDPGGLSGIVFTRSEDGGLSWLSSAIPVNPGYVGYEGHPSLGVLTDGTIVLAWGRTEGNRVTIHFSRSTDAGNTWSPALRVHPAVDAGGYSAPCLVVAGERLVIAFHRTTSVPNGCAGVVCSDDRGESWSDPVLIDPPGLPSPLSSWPPLMAHNGPRGTLGMLLIDDGGALLFTASSDGGAHWSPPERVNDIDAPVTWGDLTESGGWFQVAWAGRRPGEYIYDAYYTRSADGVHWKPSVRVSPDDLGGSQTSIRGDAAGTLHVAWTSYGATWGDSYYTCSFDGGESWPIPTVRINDVTGSVNPTTRVPPGLLADASGRAYAIWSDTRYFGSTHIFFGRSSGTTDVEGSVVAASELRLELWGSPGADPRLVLRGGSGVSGATIGLFTAGGACLGRARAGLELPLDRPIRLEALTRSRRVPAGVFFLHIEGGGGGTEGKAIVLR